MRRFDKMAQRKKGDAKPQKMKSYPSFAAWKRDQSAENQKLIDSLARLVKKTAPEFSPTVKWGQGCWTLAGCGKMLSAGADAAV